MIQTPKLELDFVMGLSTAHTSRKTSFFLKNNHVLAPAGRQLFIFRSQIFEQNGISKGIKREDQHLIKMESDCQKLLRKYPRAIFHAGHSNKKKNFFVYNIKELSALEDDDISVDALGKAGKDFDKGFGFKHPTIFFLNCEKGEGEWGEKKNDMNHEIMVQSFNNTEYASQSESKKWKQKKNVMNLNLNELKLQIWEFREFKNCYFEDISLFSYQKEHHLIALTSDRPQSLISFNFTRMKTTGINALIKKNIYDRIAVNPEDKYLVIATGVTHKTIKLHRINDKMKGDEFVVKSSIKHEGLAHPQWLNTNCFIVASNEGFGIFLFCLNKKLKIELIQRIEKFDGMYSNDLYIISFIQGFSQGFICGMNDGTALLFFDDRKGLIRYKMKKGNEDRERFLPISRVQLASSRAKPIALDFIPGEDKFLKIDRKSVV